MDEEGAAVEPDRNKSLAKKGLMHKDVIHFRTPGPTGLCSFS